MIGTEVGYRRLQSCFRRLLAPFLTAKMIFRPAVHWNRYKGRCLLGPRKLLVRLVRHGEICCQGGFINPKSGRMSPLPINTPDKFRTPRSPKAWETSFARLGLTGVLEEVVAETWMSDRRNPLRATCWN